jgi:hypothetical protein
MPTTINILTPEQQDTLGLMRPEQLIRTVCECTENITTLGLAIKAIDSLVSSSVDSSSEQFSQASQQFMAAAVNEMDELNQIKKIAYAKIKSLASPPATKHKRT